MVPYNPHIKRGLDILLSSAAFLLLSPCFVFLGILICIESEGGPFFLQRRIGRSRVPFRLIKFRTMKSDRAAATRQFEPGGSLRITRFGKLLRRAKVDELPELFNVLLGEMSLVGARPEVDKYVRMFPVEFNEVLELKPGLSDLASIKYRNEEKVLAEQVDPEAYYRTVILPDKLRLAKWYVGNSSFKTDVRIIGMTLRSIFGRRTGRHERWIEACIEADAPSTRVRG